VNDDGLDIDMFREKGHAFDPISFVCREVYAKARMCDDGIRLVRKHVDSQSHILRTRKSQPVCIHR
jgi:hypothetical protein